MDMRKRIISLFLVLTLLIGLAPAVFAADKAFTDVGEADWFCAPVQWAVENGITSGLSESEFGPNVTCTRAQVVTFLYAAAGKPALTDANNPFADVAEADWFCAPVLWAVENGITSGLSDTEFGPNEPCTRAQVVTFLYAAAGKPTLIDANKPFADVAETDWFRAPVLWAVENGITSGLTPDSFGANEPCTRGQIVTFLYSASKLQPAEPTPTPSNAMVDAYYSHITYKIDEPKLENGFGTAKVTFTAPNLFSICSDLFETIFVGGDAVDEDELTQQAKSHIETALNASDTPTLKTVTDADVQLTDDGELRLTDEAYADLIIKELEKTLVMILVEVMSHE